MADTGFRELAAEDTSSLKQGESEARPSAFVTAHMWQGCQARFATDREGSAKSIAQGGTAMSDDSKQQHEETRNAQTQERRESSEGISGRSGQVTERQATTGQPAQGHSGQRTEQQAVAGQSTGQPTEAPHPQRLPTVTSYIRAEQRNPASSAQAQGGTRIEYPMHTPERHALIPESPSRTTITPFTEFRATVNPREQNPVQVEGSAGVNVRYENLTHQGGHRAFEAEINVVGIGGSHPSIGVEGSVSIGETASRHGHPTEQVDEQTRVNRTLDEAIQHAMRGTNHGEKELPDTHTQQGLVEKPGHQDLAHEHIRLPGGVNTDAALDLPAAAAMDVTSTPQVILRPDVESMPSSTSFIGIQDAHVLSPISLDPGADLMSPMGVQAGTHAAERSEEPAEHSRPDRESVDPVSVYLRPDQEFASRVLDIVTSGPGHQEPHVSHVQNYSFRGGETHVDGHGNVSTGERDRAPAPGGLPPQNTAGQSADAIVASAAGHPIWIDPGAHLVSPMGVPASTHAAAHGKESPDRGDVGDKFSAEVWHGLHDQSAFHPEQHVVPLHGPFPPTAAPHSEANLGGNDGGFVPPPHQPAPHPGNISPNTNDHILQQGPDQTDHHFDGGNYH